MDDPGGFRAERQKSLSDRPDPFGRVDADEKTADAGGIGERPQHVEDRAGAELDARGADEAHGGMVRRREHEADAGLRHDRRDAIGRQVDIDPQRRQDVGRPGAGRKGAVAVLGDRHPAAGHHEGGAGRHVVGAGMVAAGSDNIDGVGRGRDPRHVGAHHIDRTGDLVGRLAAHAQRHEKAADLRRRRLAGHQDTEGRARFLARQGLATGDLADQRLEACAHRTATLAWLSAVLFNVTGIVPWR